MSNLNSLGLNGPPAETRVVVAMSGGVDSSVVAGLLKAEGYDVIGITLQLYDHGSSVDRPGSCCAGRDIHDARRVAQTLSIPHYVLDYEDRFANSVMESFADSYLAGETPIPCVTCNQEVKFKDLLKTARDLDAAALATGHYIASRPVPGGWGLYRAADEDRDQSYFLFATTREQLSFVRFPLGDMSKSEVRRLAGEYGLGIADKPDSQDICFVPSGGYAKVIERLRPGASEPGRIVHVDGTVLGRHDGIVNFTIGQRRGLGIAWHEPLFVIALDVAKHQVLVGPRSNLRSHWISMRDVNWLGDTALDTITEDGIDIWARIRSSQPPQAARLVANNGQIKVCLLDGEDGVSPGQACVFYSDGSPRARVLGGGWIAAVQSASECAANGDPFQGADMALESAGVTKHQP